MRSIFKPSKAFASFKNYGSEFFGSSIILYFVTYWMILVYICFMPDYLRVIFQKAPFRFTQSQFNYLNNLRVFAVYAFLFYIIYLFFKSIIYKICGFKKFKNFITADLYYFGLNLIFFLLIIIIGNFSSNYIMLGAFILFEGWIILLNILSDKTVLNTSLVKSFFSNAASILITSALLALSLIYLYRF